MAEFVAIPDALGGTLGLYSQVGQTTGWISPLFPVGTIVNVTTIAQTVTFFFRGFFAGSGQYEFWSGPSRNTPNPSGHSLTNVTVVAELVGTGAF